MSLGNITYLFVAIEDKKLLSLVEEEIKDWSAIIVKSCHLADTIISDRIKNDWFHSRKVKQVALVNVTKELFSEAQEKWAKWDVSLILLNFSLKEAD